MLAKGVKRKRAEMEAGEAPAEAVSGGGGPGAPSASLFNISMLKLHRSLRHVEPNLRYLVLVANTLRRLQGPAPAPEPPAGPHGPPGSADHPLLLSGWDVPPDATAMLAPATMALDAMEGPGGRADALRPPPAPPGCLSPLELLGAPSLLDDSLDGLFEDIDTSMYDCDLWAPGSLAGFKAFAGTEEEEGEEAEGSGRLDMDDLDYLMDVLVGTRA
ncbi:SRTD1 protein, partial [Nothoprocta pentlandii]|nr:SRTD1 protein [Nothoprocta pentlandii]